MHQTFSPKTGFVKKHLTVFGKTVRFYIYIYTHTHTHTHTHIYTLASNELIYLIWYLFPGGVNGNPLQYSCLENPMDKGA